MVLSSQVLTSVYSVYTDMVTHRSPGFRTSSHHLVWCCYSAIYILALEVAVRLILLANANIVAQYVT